MLLKNVRCKQIGLILNTRKLPLRFSFSWEFWAGKKEEPFGMYINKNWSNLTQGENQQILVANSSQKNLLETSKQIKATTKTENEQNQTSKQNLEFELLYFLVGTIFLLDLYTCTDTKKWVGGSEFCFPGGSMPGFFVVFCCCNFTMWI